MSRDEVLADLNERLGRAIVNLERRQPNETVKDRARLDGKVQGLKLVKDWLRGY